MIHTVQGELPSSLSATLNTVGRKSSLQPFLPYLVSIHFHASLSGVTPETVDEISAGPSGTDTEGTERQPSRWPLLLGCIKTWILWLCFSADFDYHTSKKIPRYFQWRVSEWPLQGHTGEGTQTQNPLIPQIYHNLVKCPRAHIPSRLRNPFPHPSLVTRPETGHSHILFEWMEKQRKEQRPVCALQHLSSMPCPFPLPRGLSSNVIKTRGKAQLWPQIKNILLWSTKLVKQNCGVLM